MWGRELIWPDSVYTNVTCHSGVFCWNIFQNVFLRKHHPRHILSWWGPGCPIAETKCIGWGYPRPTNSGKWRFIGGPSEKWTDYYFTVSGWGIPPMHRSFRFHGSPFSECSPGSLGSAGEIISATLPVSAKAADCPWCSKRKPWATEGTPQSGILTGVIILPPQTRHFFTWKYPKSPYICIKYPPKMGPI